MTLKTILFFLFLSCFLKAYSQEDSSLLLSKKLSPPLLDLLQKPKNKITGATYSSYQFICSDSNAILSVIKNNNTSGYLVKTNASYKLFIVAIKENSLLKKIIHLPEVLYADLYHTPKEELEVGNYDPSLNRINQIQKKYPAADGTGITVSIKENIFDTLDIDFKGRIIKTGNASAIFSTHASIMATLVAGAGNSSAGSLGVAPGATISSSNFSNLFPDPGSLLQQNNITVQNHSYGTVVENFYGAEARAYDQQLNSLPSLVHVFSAGNSGIASSSTGLYAGIPGMANLTGNFKQAKNCILVAATDSFNQVPAAISKGPAFDGRVKPEITAFGEDGSSGAAAIVSGTIIRLQHLYRQFYNNLPESALLKAILLNSADDIGAAGIDFFSGYGALNASRAADHIAQNRFFAGAVTQNSQQTFPITIAPGMKKFSCTLAWNDPANTSLVPKALVNNIDLSVVRLSDNFTFYPWVLNSFPHLDSLRQLPQRKIDTLNNTEQVSFDFPVPGNYEIRVTGSSVPAAPQTYFIAYQFDSLNVFEFTYPLQNNYIQAGKSNTIRWKQNINGNAILQYTIDNNTWHTITNNADLSKGYYIWNAPDTMTTAKLRITGSTTISSDTFVIGTAPALEVGFNCSDDFMLWWNKIKNTGNYRLYRLGNKYMEPFITQTDTFALFTKSAQPALYYAIQPILLNGFAAQRSTAANYTTQGVDCYFKNFLAQLNGNIAEIQLELGTINGVVSFILEKQTGNTFIPLQTMQTVVQRNYIFSDQNLKTGLNVYRIRLLRSNGQEIFSATTSVYYFGNQPYLIFPNPTTASKGFRMIAANQNNGEVFLFNMLGQLVLRYKTKQAEEWIATNNLKTGIYFYTILEYGKPVQIGKLIVQ